MANLRYLKKEIDYRLEEVVFDCDMAICFQPSKETEIFEVMQEAVAVRNDLFTKANNPAEPHNPSLVRKHYAALRAEKVKPVRSEYGRFCMAEPLFLPSSGIGSSPVSFPGYFPGQSFRHSFLPVFLAIS